MKRYRARRWLRERLDRASSALDPDAFQGWRRLAPVQHQRWVSDAARKFPDTDKLAAFGDAARLRTNADRVTLDQDGMHLIRHLGGNQYDEGGADISKELAEHLATGLVRRDNFEIRGLDESGTWTWMLALRSGRARGAAAEIAVRGNDGDWPLGALKELLDLHTVAMSQKDWRRGAPLLEALPARDVAQADREAIIAHKAARTGGWWGFAGGVLGGVLSALGAVLLANPGT